MRLKSSAGEREVAASEFLQGLLTTDLGSDEMLVEIAFPAPKPRTGTCFMEVARRRGDFALAGVAAIVTLDEERRCARSRLALCGVGETPVDASDAAASLVGQPCTDEAIEAVAAEVQEMIEPSGNVHAHAGLSAPYRRRSDAARARHGAATGRSWSLTGHDIELSVNGTSYRRTSNSRMLLSDFLRHDLLLAGTHVGCEHGVCGACTILLDGAPVRSCLMLAVQANGHELSTVEGLATSAGELHPVQQAMHEHHGLQCGYCTPGILMTMTAFLKENHAPSEDEVREALSGNLCRCTGYQNIVDAMLAAARRCGRPRHDHPLFRRAGQTQRGPQAPDRTGAVHRRRRTARHAACRLPAQPGGACPYQDASTFARR